MNQGTGVTEANDLLCNLSDRLPAVAQLWGPDVNLRLSPVTRTAVQTHSHPPPCCRGGTGRLSWLLVSNGNGRMERGYYIYTTILYYTELNMCCSILGKAIHYYDNTMHDIQCYINTNGYPMLFYINILLHCFMPCY